MTGILPTADLLYELDGEECQTSPLQAAGGERWRVHLATERAAGMLALVEGAELRLRWQTERGQVRRVGLNLFVPADAVLHLAERQNVGHRFDRSMPLGEWYRCKLAHNFLVIEWQGRWVRLRSCHSHGQRAEVEIVRHPEQLRLTFAWAAEAEAGVAEFASLAAAVADFRRWLASELGVRPLSERAGLPGWVQNVRLVITADMLRSNWEVSHDYADVARLAQDLARAGCPSDTLIYIPGWQGGYDSTHPTYWPRPELGGEEGFRRMVEAIHRAGLRLMLHTTGWGIDPYHPDIDRLQQLALRDADGDYWGWQMNRKWLPPRRPLKVQSAPLPLGAARGQRSFVVESDDIPDRCEVLVTLGGVRVGQGRVRLTLGRRTITSPPGWFAAHEAFEYPFPLLLEPGVNRIQVELVGEGDPDWRGGWLRLGYSFTPPSPFSSWTWPILVADTSNPAYIELYTGNVARAVETFGVDAVHVDATWFDTPEFSPPARELLLALRRRLPGVPLSGEAVLSLEELGFWTFAQSAAQGLVHAAGPRPAPSEQGALPLEEGLDELHTWLDQESPVCAFAREYVVSYPHLCAAHAFVPVGKVCNTFPARRMPLRGTELWRTLRDAARLNYVPGLRVNYRQYGLDEETVQAIRELSGGI